jgi:hypothetical protein
MTKLAYNIDEAGAQVGLAELAHLRERVHN